MIGWLFLVFGVGLILGWTLKSLHVQTLFYIEQRGERYLLHFGSRIIGHSRRADGAEHRLRRLIAIERGRAH